MKSSDKEARKRYKDLPEGKCKRKKRSEKEIKVLLKKKKRKSISMIVNIIKIFLRNKSRS